MIISNGFKTKIKTTAKRMPAGKSFNCGLNPLYFVLQLQACSRWFLFTKKALILNPDKHNCWLLNNNHK